MGIDAQELDSVLGIDNPDADITPEQELDKIAESLLEVNERLEQLKSLKVSLEDKIWTLTPEEVGEFAVEGDEFMFTVKRNEKWTWDSDVIKSKLVTTPTPDFVNAKFSINKKKFLAEDQAVQADFLDALTKSPSTAKVTPLRKA